MQINNLATASLAIKLLLHSEPALLYNAAKGNEIFNAGERAEYHSFVQKTFSVLGRRLLS